MPDSRQDNVDQQPRGYGANAGPLHGNGGPGPYDPRCDNAAANLLAADAAEPGRLLQGYHAGVGDSHGHRLQVFLTSQMHGYSMVLTSGVLVMYI